MTKYFWVQIGQLVREQQTVLVGIPDDKSQQWLSERSQLSEVYEKAEDAGCWDWEEDVHWGCQESDSHQVICQADLAEAMEHLESGEPVVRLTEESEESDGSEVSS